MDGNKIVSPKNGVIKGSTRSIRGEAPYRFIGLKENGKEFRLNLHRLVAFQKYGDYAFGKGIVTRHKDGDSLNNDPENIVIGSVRDNIMDRPKGDRVAHSKRANEFPKKRMTKYQKEMIVGLFETGMSMKKISIEMDIPRSTIGYFLRNGSIKHGIPAYK